jgi:hypothetical protein
MALAVMERSTTTLAEPIEDEPIGDESLSSIEERDLHYLPYQHVHWWQTTSTMSTTTQAPTRLSDEYYTDDGAISDNMIRDRKDVYNQEHNIVDIGETNELNDPSLLVSEPTVSIISASDAGHRQWGNWLVASGVHILLAWSFLLL